MPELKIGYQGALYNPWYDWAAKSFKSYAFLLGARDGYYGGQEAAFTRELQRRLGIVQDGIFGDRTAAAAGYRWPGDWTLPVVQPRRPIWLYSAPGSGAPYWLGPSHDLGQMVCGLGFNGPGRESLRINHQPVGYPIGGYLGLMGGDPKYSYIEVITMQGAEQERLLDENPDVQVAMAVRRTDPRAAVDVELWFSAYSQSADGALEAVNRLFGDGGKYELIRDRINGLILFGNPATPGTGIARKTFPGWLNAVTRNINVANDFYAIVKDEIRPAFYAEIIKAELELPFFVHVLRIAVPIILKWASTLIPIFGPLLGGFGPMVQLALGSLNGLQGLGNNPLLGQLMGQAGGGLDVATTKRIEDILSPTGLFENIGGLIGLIAALPGLQAHGAYHLPLADFGGRTGPQVGFDIIASYRR